MSTSELTAKIEETIANCTDYCYLLDYKDQIEEMYTEKITDISKTIAELTPVVDLIALLTKASDLLSAAQDEYSQIMTVKDVVTGEIITKLATLENELKTELQQAGQDISNIDLNAYCSNRKLV